MKISPSILSLSALAIALASACPAFAQVPPILPTDVTGPNAGGMLQGLHSQVGIQNGVSAVFPSSFSHSEQIFGRLLVPSNQSQQILTYPSIINSTGGDGQPIVVPVAPARINIPLNPAPSPSPWTHILIYQ